MKRNNWKQGSGPEYQKLQDSDVYFPDFRSQSRLNGIVLLGRCLMAVRKAVTCHKLVAFPFVSQDVLGLCRWPINLLDGQASAILPQLTLLKGTIKVLENMHIFVSSIDRFPATSWCFLPCLCPLSHPLHNPDSCILSKQEKG